MAIPFETCEKCGGLTFGFGYSEDSDVWCDCKDEEDDNKT